MNNIVICQIGEGDNFSIALSAGDKLLPISIEQAGSLTAAGTSVRKELERVAVSPTPVALDLLNLATAVYSADVCTRRITAFDRWTREFIVHLPVSDVDRWSAVADLLSQMLGFLSGDRWQILFRSLEKPIPPYVKRKRAKPARCPSAVSLFSGGLDSFIGVLDLLEKGNSVAFVGHYSTGPTSVAQDKVNTALEKHYPERTSLFRFYVRPPIFHGNLPEPSTRSRSILFLALGTLVASSFGDSIPLYVPENGLISLNVPLTPARSGTLSTRTTHPHYIQLFRELLARIGINTPIETPYRFKTKGEMLAEALNQTVLREVAPQTLSCSHPDVGRYHGIAPGRHCGYCVPCIIRRASLAHIGADGSEDYLIDVLRNPPGAGTQTGKDFRAFEMALARQQGGLRSIHNVLNSGPLPPNDATAYAAVYERGMKEVGRLLSPTSSS